MSRGDDNKQDEDNNKSLHTSKSGASRKSNSATLRNSSVSSSIQQFCIDDKLIIDPKLLSVRTKIGEGAHGKVYEGKYNDQVVAVKVLNGGSTPEERATLEGRFAREIAMMSRVKHDNLVKFIGACKEPYMIIITELLPGMSLRKFLINVRPNQLDQRVAIGYALDIARAMECLHANGIIHRDLKPGKRCMICL